MLMLLFSIVLFEIMKKLLWNFSLKWLLREGCLKWKFQPDRFLNFKFLYVEFYCITWLLRDMKFLFSVVRRA